MPRSPALRPRLFPAPVLVTLAAVACASGGARRAPGADFATLEVRNNSLGPVDLYAVRDGGFTQRIASAVTASRLTRVRLGPSIVAPGGTVNIVAVPLAEHGRASTGRLVLRPGDVVQFTITPDLATSSVFVR